MPRWAWAAAMLLVLSATALLVWRGPVRAVMEKSDEASDFLLLYTSSRAWAEGSDPYDPANLERIYEQAGGTEAGTLLRRGREAFIYPPATFVAYQPFTWLPWRGARVAWAVLSTGLWLTAIVMLARMAELPGRWLGTWLAGAVGIALAPAHTAIAFGQSPVLVAVLLTMAFMPRSGTGRGGWLGLASAIKPQLGVPFVAYAAYRRQWRALAVALGVAGLIALLAVVRLEWAGIDWLAGLQRNIHEFVTRGAGKPTLDNPIRQQMIHLQTLTMTLLPGSGAATGVAWAIVGLLAGAHFLPWRAGAEDGPDRRLASLSLVAVLTLLVAYHRFYDAVLLLLPVMWWARCVWRRKNTALAWTGAAMLLPFVLPTAAMLQRFERWGWVPEALTQASWWWPVAKLHQVWALLGLAVVLILAGKRAGSEGSGSNQPMDRQTP